MKGLIAEVQGNRAVLLTSDGTFRKIPNRGYRIGQEVSIRRVTARRVSAWAASCAAVIALVAGSSAVYSQPVEYLSLDINPSFMLEINRFGRVTDVLACNADGQRLLGQIKRRGELQACLRDIVEKSEMFGYLEEEKYIEITVEKNGKTETADKVCAWTAEEGVRCQTRTADSAEIQEALERNVSVGMLRALRDYAEESGTDLETAVQKAEGESVRELRQKTADLRRERMKEERSATWEKETETKDFDEGSPKTEINEFGKGMGQSVQGTDGMLLDQEREEEREERKEARNEEREEIKEAREEAKEERREAQEEKREKREDNREEKRKVRPGKGNGNESGRKNQVEEDDDREDDGNDGD